MMSLYETLVRDIPVLAKEYGENEPYILQLKQQVADIEASREPRENPETEEYHAMIVPNPKD